jgi:hypothetical protein
LTIHKKRYGGASSPLLLSRQQKRPNQVRPAVIELPRANARADFAFSKRTNYG